MLTGATTINQPRHSLFSSRAQRSTTAHGADSLRLVSSKSLGCSDCLSCVGTRLGMWIVSVIVRVLASVTFAVLVTGRAWPATDNQPAAGATDGCRPIHLSITIHSTSTTSPWTSVEALKSYLSANFKPTETCLQITFDAPDGPTIDVSADITTSTRGSFAQDLSLQDNNSVYVECRKRFHDGSLSSTGDAAVLLQDSEDAIVPLLHGFAKISATQKLNCAIHFSETSYCNDTSLEALRRQGYSESALYRIWENSIDGWGLR